VVLPYCTYAHGGHGTHTYRLPYVPLHHAMPCTGVWCTHGPWPWGVGVWWQWWWYVPVGVRFLAWAWKHQGISTLG